MASLGQELKRERELRGITLKEISDSTRISLKFLQALEEDHLDILPGNFFVRAILRSYAKSIGLDENQVLNRYQELMAFDEYQLDKEPRPKRTPYPILTPKRILLLSGILIAAVFAVLFFFLFISGSEKTRTQAGQAEKIQARPSAPPLSAPSPAPPDPVKEEVKGVSLDITFLEETWIQAFADGRNIWDGIKNQGEILRINGLQEVTLNLGNAGGLDLTINGKKAKPLGPRGAVRKDIKITLSNYGEFLEPREEKQS